MSDALPGLINGTVEYYNKDTKDMIWDYPVSTTIYPVGTLTANVGKMRNEPVTEDVNEDGYGWCDSEFEYQAAACFINNPDLYRNYVEFELSEPTKVWVGLKKDVNAPTQYWNPFRDFTIEKYVDGDNTGVNDIISDDENAPVEYFNLQGVRVANPENGVFIVKQGKKVSKVVLK